MTAGTSACYFCGETTLPGARFCGACGHACDLPRCSSCGHMLVPGSQYCAACGAPLSPRSLYTLPHHPQEELRQVTVLFVLFGGLQLLVEQVDPEELKELMDQCFRRLTSEIQSRDGTIDKYMVDSMLALFGYPAAHEDDPARAVAAALGMVDAMESFNRELYDARGVQLGLKIGINTGKVVIGYVSQEMTVMGDVVNTASRLEREAPVGGILISSMTRRHLGDLFQLKSEPPLVVKGKQAPLTVYRVLHRPAAPEECSQEAARLPFIGREREFDQLALLWRQLVRPGQGLTESLNPVGVWVTIWGDAGIGKGRLIREFIHYIARDPCRPQIHMTLGQSMAAGAGFEVLRRLILSLAGVLPRDDTEQAVERIQKLSKQVAGRDPITGEQVRPETIMGALLNLCGMSVDKSRRPSPALVHDPLKSRALGLHYLVTICAEFARERPLLIAATDLQWAEEPALEFFEVLGNALPPQLMLLTSARGALKEQRPRWGAGNPCHKTISLPPLTDTDTASLARLMVGEKADISQRFIKKLYRFTGGNPLFLIETLRNLIETDSILETDGSDFRVPDSIEGVIQSRLDRLPFDEALTLRAAAVVGPTFWRGAVEAILGSNRAETLERLQEKGFVCRCPQSSLAGEVERRFDHHLISWVAQGNLLDEVRRRYHRATAEWLADRTSQPQPLEALVAHHYELGDARTQAAEYYARAGERALASHRCGDATSLLTRAIECISGADDPDRLRLEARVLTGRGEARRMVANFEEALADLEQSAKTWAMAGDPVQTAASWYRFGLAQLGLERHEAAEQAVQAGDSALEGQAAPPVQALGWYLESELLNARGDSARAASILRQAVFIWRQIDERWLLAQGLALMGQIQFARAEISRSRQTFLEVISLQEALGDYPGLAVSLYHLSTAAEAMGRFPESLAHLHRSLRLARQVKNRNLIADVLRRQGIGYLRIGYFGRARSALEEALESDTPVAEVRHAPEVLYQLGRLWLSVGQAARAAESFEGSLECLNKAADLQPICAMARAGLARCRLLEDNFDAAESLVNDLFAAARGTYAQAIEASALQLACEISLQRGELARALEYVEELEWNETVQRSLELQIAVSLLTGRVMLATKRAKSACSYFTEAERIARTHDLAPARWRASACLLQAVQAVDSARDPEAEDASREAYRELSARVEARDLRSLLERQVHRAGALSPG